ncbi:hypothetical protein ACHAWF_012348 [Thalassiosira exigua]
MVHSATTQYKKKNYCMWL